MRIIVIFFTILGIYSSPSIAQLNTFLTGNNPRNTALISGTQTRLGSLVPDMLVQGNVRIGSAPRPYLDYVGFDLCIPLSDNTALSVPSSGISYLQNLNGKLIGSQTFNLPTISQLLSLSIFKAGVSINILRNYRQGVDDPTHVLLNWEFDVSYTPINLDGTIDDVAQSLNDINNRIKQITNSATNPDSAKKAITNLTNVANSLKEIPQSQYIKNISPYSAKELVSSTSGTLNNALNVNNNLMFLYYTGPSVVFTHTFHYVPNLDFQAYARYLWQINNKDAVQLTIPSTTAVLDSATKYIGLLDSLHIPVKDTSSYSKNPATISGSVFVFGSQLSLNFYAISFFLAYQGTYQANRESKSLFDNNYYGSNFKLGLRIDLTKVFTSNPGTTAAGFAAPYF